VRVVEHEALAHLTQRFQLIHLGRDQQSDDVVQVQHDLWQQQIDAYNPKSEALYKTASANNLPVDVPPV
jgi:hypothetical protein